MNKPTLLKIPLKGLLTILTELYEEGVNFIDITGSELSDVKDQMDIIVKPEYYASQEELDEEKKQFDEIVQKYGEQDESFKVTKINDNDLNDIYENS